MRIVFLGAPGCGKGTQVGRLVHRYEIKSISTGDMLRAEIRKGSVVGLKADEFVSRGDLVPDSIILEMMEMRMNEPDVANGFVLDGFPRSVAQAEGLDRILNQGSGALDAVIKLEVSEEAILERLAGRRICPECSAVYNLSTNSPKVAGKCDNCGAALVHREDDTEATIRMRLKVYEDTTAELADYYDRQHLLRVVDGEGSEDQVESRIVRALEGSGAGSWE